MSNSPKFNKRRKTAPHNHNDIHIVDLPDEAVRLIANYLPKTSRALLAVALTTEPSRWSKVDWTPRKASTPSLLSLWGKGTRRKRMTAATKALVLAPSRKKNDELWSEIDFGDLEPILACRLSDDDIASVLSCVDARHKLKSLVLTGCIDIIGTGLAPLHGSEVLERFDISFVGRHGDPDSLEYEPFLMSSILIPILESMIDRENSSLKYIQFPAVLRDTNNGMMDPFMKKYNQSKNQRDAHCTDCHLPCQDILSHSGTRVINTHATQSHTCYSCLKTYCYNCADKKGNPRLAGCHGCQKEFCTDCVSMIPCATCHPGDYNHAFCSSSYYCSEECARRFTCQECGEAHSGNWTGCHEVAPCKGCNRTACRSCLDFVRCCFQDFDGASWIPCKEGHCRDCFDGLEHTVKRCGKCSAQHCFRHRLKVCEADWFGPFKMGGKEMGDACSGCMEIIAPKLLECHEKFDLIEPGPNSDHFLLELNGEQFNGCFPNYSERCEKCCRVVKHVDRLEECRRIRKGKKADCLECLKRILVGLAATYRSLERDDESKTVE